MASVINHIFQYLRGEFAEEEEQSGYIGNRKKQGSIFGGFEFDEKEDNKKSDNIFTMNDENEDPRSPDRDGDEPRDLKLDIQIPFVYDSKQVQKVSIIEALEKCIGK